jgi:hypothetical protein
MHGKKTFPLDEVFALAVSPKTAVGGTAQASTKSG